MKKLEFAAYVPEWVRTPPIIYKNGNIDYTDQISDLKWSTNFGHKLRGDFHTSPPLQQA